MKFDIKQARLAYDLHTGNYGAGNFAQFSPAYAVTNEDIREVFWTLNPRPGARVLTVAGSGDQALHYKLAGASHVDTFDITFNAKMMMDIKTAAIQKLNRTDYVNLINSVSRSRDISDIPQYKQIMDAMPTDSHMFICQMQGARLVRGGLYCETLYNDEFTRLKQLIDKPFNFIWTDVEKLSTHLTQEYDQIYLSNIIQYHAKADYVIPLVMDLARFLKSGGTMMVNVAPFFVADDMEALCALRSHVEKARLGTVKLIHTHWYDMYVYQKS